MKKYLIPIVFVILALLIASPMVAAQDVEGRVIDLEGREHSLKNQVQELQALTAAQQATIAGLQVTVAELTALVEGLGGEPDPAIAANSSAIALNDVELGINFASIQSHTSDLDNLFLRLEDLEILVEEGGAGGAGSPGLVIAANNIGPATDASIYPFDVPIYSAGCTHNGTVSVRACFLFRDKFRPLNFEGMGLFGTSWSTGINPVRIFTTAPQ